MPHLIDTANIRAVRRAPLIALLVLITSCARKAPPSGGPPDIEPPRVVSATPDSGTARVALNTPITVTFSEGMEPRTTGSAVALAPRVDFRAPRWHGRTLTLIPEAPLAPNHTYTLFVGGAARDRHGNVMASPRALVFSTADSFPPGALQGTLEARGFSAQGTYLWVYKDPRAPDSTARDFDALGVADPEGRFSVVGLPVPGRYRLWAFADLNNNLSFEPDRDVLAPADTLISLTAAAPDVRGLAVRAVNPRAKAVVRGAVIDSTGDSLGVVRVIAVSEADTALRVVVDATETGSFEMQLDAGAWDLRAFRDRDKDHVWRVDLEPASAIERITVTPAEERTDVKLRLRRVLGGP